MKKIRIVLIALMALVLLALPVSANSALMFWSGSEGSDVYMMSENCPVKVSHEKLVFNVNQLPDRGYATPEAFNALDSSVTAIYSFHNPADYDVSARLYFPIGRIPDYAPGIRHLSFERYQIRTDGRETNYQLRYYYPNGDFKIEEALEKLKDEKIQDELLSEDTLVIRYDYQVETNEGMWCEFSLEKGRFVLVSHYNGTRVDADHNSFGLFYNDRNEKTSFSVYLFGQENYLGEPHFYENAAAEKEVENRLILTGQQSMTLKEALNDFCRVEGISEVDRHNCLISRLKEISSYLPAISLEEFASEMSYMLICGYEYQLTIPAGQTVTNEVTAPLYPSIDGYYDPPYHQFTYLSSPAKTWSSFNDLDIEIRTPYYASSFSAGELQKTDYGYQAHLDGLPQDEITFRLCASESPDHIRNGSYNIIIWIILAMLVLGLIVIITVTVLIVKAVRRRRNRS